METPINAFSLFFSKTVNWKLTGIILLLFIRDRLGSKLWFLLFQIAIFFFFSLSLRQCSVWSKQKLTPPLFLSLSLSDSLSLSLLFSLSFLLCLSLSRALCPSLSVSSSVCFSFVLSLCVSLSLVLFILSFSFFLALPFCLSASSIFILLSQFLHWELITSSVCPSIFFSTIPMFMFVSL
jgi:hypothetical protein